jgi:hypothetical protein
LASDRTVGGSSGTDGARMRLIGFEVTSPSSSIHLNSLQRAEPRADRRRLELLIQVLEERLDVLARDRVDGGRHPAADEEVRQLLRGLGVGLDGPGRAPRGAERSLPRREQRRDADADVGGGGCSRTALMPALRCATDTRQRDKAIPLLATPTSAPGGSRAPNLLIRSYPALDAVRDKGIDTATPSETGGVIRCL